MKTNFKNFINKTWNGAMFKWLTGFLILIAAISVIVEPSVKFIIALFSITVFYWFLVWIFRNNP